jgi:hypothetical protein
MTLITLISQIKWNLILRVISSVSDYLCETLCGDRGSKLNR